MVQRYREEVSCVRRRGQGRHRKTTTIQDHFLRITTLREMFTTTRYLQMELARADNMQVSLETIRRRLNEVNVHPTDQRLDLC